MIFYENINTLVLFLSDKCNLNCSYCGNEKRNHKTLKIYLIKKIVNNIIKKSNTKKLVVQFYGGEPLLFFFKIKDIIYFIEKNKANKKIIYRICTNGTLINKEILDCIKKYKIQVQISADDITSKTTERITSSAVYLDLLNNLDLIRSLKMQKFFSIHSVLTPLNIKNYYQHVSFLYKKYGFKSFSFHRVCNYKKMNSKYYYNLKAQVKKLKRLITTVGQKNIYIDQISDSKNYGHNICKPFNKRIMIMPDGVISPCDLACFYLTGKNKFNLMKKNTNKIMQEFINFSNKKFYEEQQYNCITCINADKCTICPLMNYIETGSFYKTSNDHCKFIKALS